MSKSGDTAIRMVAFPDVYLYWNRKRDRWTIHLVRGEDYRKAQEDGSESVKPLHKCIDVPVGPDDHLPAEVMHYGDYLTPMDFYRNPSRIASLIMLNHPKYRAPLAEEKQRLCLNCLHEYNDGAVTEDAGTAHFNMDTGNWSL